MRVVKVLSPTRDFHYKWPSGDDEPYPNCTTYEVIAEDGRHQVRVAFGTRPVYGKDRVRVVIFIDKYPHAEFFGSDDIDVSGDVLSEIKVRGDIGEVLCRYPEDAVPERYSSFSVVGLPTRVNSKGVHNAWAVVANLSDHQTMIALAALRRIEREH